MRCDALTRTTTSTTTLRCRWRWGWRSTALCRYISHSVSLEVEVEDVARLLLLPCHKAFQRKAWHFNLQADADRRRPEAGGDLRQQETWGRRQDTTEAVNNMQQTCKYANRDALTILQPNQICNCSGNIFPSRALSLSFFSVYPSLSPPAVVSHELC